MLSVGRPSSTGENAGRGCGGVDGAPVAVAVVGNAGVRLAKSRREMQLL